MNQNKLKEEIMNDLTKFFFIYFAPFM